MTTKYTLKSLVNMSGGKGIKVGGEIPNLNALQVAKLLRQGTAEFKTAKELKAFNDGFEAEAKAKEEKEIEAKAILEKETLENNFLLSVTDMVNKKAALDGVVLDEKEVLEKVESLIKFFG